MEHHKILQLIQSCRQGVSESFSPIIRQYQARIYRLCNQFLATPQDVEDAVSDVFIKVFRSLNQYSSRYSFSSWISRIAINHCLEKLRRIKLEQGYFKRSLQQEDDLVDTSSPAEHYLKESQSQMIQAAVKTLPLRYKTPLLLKYQQELTYQEIGSILDVPVNTVGSLILRGKKLLRQKIVQMEKKP
jgi:RNA polymerase sigma-70 factor (ECF subfamily)